MKMSLSSICNLLLAIYTIVSVDYSSIQDPSIQQIKHYIEQNREELTEQEPSQIGGIYSIAYLSSNSSRTSFRTKLSRHLSYISHSHSCRAVEQFIYNPIVTIKSLYNNAIVINQPKLVLLWKNIRI